MAADPDRLAVGYVGWLGTKEGRGVLFVVLGVVALALYGIVAALQLVGIIMYAR